MSTFTDNQPIVSRSAKILFIGLIQYFVVGLLFVTFIDLFLDYMNNTESINIDTNAFFSSIDMFVYAHVIGTLLFTGTITLIVSGFVYLIDKKRNIKFIAPKNEPVSITRQTIYSLIPILDMYAVIKVKKFWIYVLIMIGVGLAILPLDEFGVFPQTFPENMLIQEAITIPISVVVIRIFSKKWNKQFTENSVNEETK
ncbi:MAG: hypothetical protein KGZ37_00865 [Nitrosarchaeum sp.]|nr:hypothetical protein [Nitrosarchaeum sp.]